MSIYKSFLDEGKTYTISIEYSLDTTSFIENNDVVYKKKIVDLFLGAGLGLFTRTHIAKGSCVCIYTGKVLRTIEAIRLQDKSYLMRLGPQVYVDPSDDTTVLGRYINDPRNRFLQNAIFDKRPEEQCAYVVAKRDIAAGEEIFVDYGRWYWLKKTPTRLDRLPVQEN